MIKLGWRLLKNPQVLCAFVLRSKYIQGVDLDFSRSRQYNFSPLWSGILNEVDNLRRNFMMSIGDGKSTKFWTDSWVENVGPLIGLTAFLLIRFSLIHLLLISLVLDYEIVNS